MRVDREEVRHLAWLARIELNDSEIDSYTSQIREIISYFDLLDEAEIDIEPSSIVREMQDLRDDIPFISKDDAFSVVKNRKERFVKAPKMV